MLRYNSLDRNNERTIFHMSSDHRLMFKKWKGQTTPTIKFSTSSGGQSETIFYSDIMGQSQSPGGKTL